MDRAWFFHLEWKVMARKSASPGISPSLLPKQGMGIIRLPQLSSVGSIIADGLSQELACKRPAPFPHLSKFVQN